MIAPDEAVRAELAAFLEKDSTRTGDVYRLEQQGVSRPDQIASALGLDNAGFVANNRRNARSLLEGHIPSGPKSAEQAASYVRGVLRKAYLTPEAVEYVRRLIAALDTAAGRSSPRVAAPVEAAATRPPRNDSLRRQVDADVRHRVLALTRRVRDECGLDAEDYHQAAVAEFALDVVHRLVHEQPMSTTTTALADRQRLDLSIEQAVLDWARDLPVAAPLTDAARGRIDFWRSL